MRPRHLLTGLLGSLLAFISPLKAHDVHMMPNGRLEINPMSLGDVGAVSLFGEGGEKVLRGGATYGICLDPCQRIKFSGEYLTQKLTYDFLVGPTTKKWVHQFDTGLAYEYLWGNRFLKSTEFGAAYSQSTRRRFNSLPIGVAEFNRAVSKTQGAFYYFDVDFNLWQGALLRGIAYWDSVKFRRTNQPNFKKRGWGGGVGFSQEVGNIFLSFNAEWREPFNYYEGLAEWQPICYPGFKLGLFGTQTKGKNGLPNVTTGGVQLSITWGDFCGCGDVCYGPCFIGDLADWVAVPASYLPIVLSVPDQGLSL